MAQFLRPIAEPVNQSWTGEDGDTTALYEHVDEVSVNDADYVRSPLSPNNSVIVFKLGSGIDPGVSTGHIIRIRYGKDTGGGDTIDLTVELRQAYVSEVSQGTLLGYLSAGNIPAGFTDLVYEITGATADLITDYTNLYLRFISKKV